MVPFKYQPFLLELLTILLNLFCKLVNLFLSNLKGFYRNMDSQPQWRKGQQDGK